MSDLYDLGNQISHVSLEELKEEEEFAAAKFDQEDEGINASYDGNEE